MALTWFNRNLLHCISACLVRVPSSRRPGKQLQDARLAHQTTSQRGRIVALLFSLQGSPVGDADTGRFLEIRQAAKELCEATGAYRATVIGSLC